MTTDLIPIATVQSAIRSLPGRPPFMLDSDLAAFYGTRTDLINTAVKRNPNRFPEDFAFRLTDDEFDGLRCQNGTSDGSLRTQNAFSKTEDGRGGRRYLPMAFTEAGALALSGVLKTPRAAEVSVIVFRAFVELRRGGAAERDERMETLERQHRCAAAFTLAFNPLWGRIAHLLAAGVHRGGVHRLINRPFLDTGAIIDEMERAGVIAREDWRPSMWGIQDGPSSEEVAGHLSTRDAAPGDAP